jgi:hypothetical protein
MIDKYVSREFRKRINHILFKEWDPIGVRDMEGPEDEYEMYVYGVFRMLLDGKDEEAIANHLLEIERERMGLSQPTSGEHRIAVGRILKSLSIPADASRPSA